MIDLHTHTILSDGVLIPSELVRRASVLGCEAIALTDHVDDSNIEPVIMGLVNVSRTLNKYWDIFVIPGVELTHLPLERFPELVKFARRKGAKIIVGHGESPAEPVIRGTNRAAIEAGVDILAHPGYITEEDVSLAVKKGVYLEMTLRRGHKEANAHVLKISGRMGAEIVLNSDGHSPEDILPADKRTEFLATYTTSEDVICRIVKNSERIVKAIRSEK